MNVMVTGAGGFLGRELVQRLSLRGHNVWGVSRTPPHGGNNAGRWLTWQDALARPIDGNTIEGIINCAAAVPSGTSFEVGMNCFSENLEILRQVVRIAERFPSARFVQTSSISVYGHLDNGVVLSELSICSPITPYAIAKWAVEALLKTWGLSQPNRNIIVLRCASIYGIDMPRPTVLTRFVHNARRGEDLVIFNGGGRSQDFVYVGDVADSHIAALESAHASNFEVYNIGSGQPTTMRDLAARVNELVGAGRCKIRDVLSGEESNQSFRLDINKARRALSFRPCVIEEGVARCFARRALD